MPKLMDDENQDQPLSTGWQKHNIPTTEELQMLEGKIYATLTDRENIVLNFYRNQGRELGVSVSIINDADPDELARAKSKEQAEKILKAASKISVTIHEDTSPVSDQEVFDKIQEIARDDLKNKPGEVYRDAFLKSTEDKKNVLDNKQ